MEKTSDTWVEVARFTSLSEATVARTALEACGIEVMIPGEEFSSLLPLTDPVAPGIPMQVRAAHAETALGILTKRPASPAPLK